MSTAAARPGRTSRPAAMVIPRVFHRIWLGDAPMPEEYVRFGEGWEALHPAWTMKLWTDADLPPLRNQAAFDAATSQAQRADIARYEILAEHGGVYLDVDFEALRNLEPVLRGRRAFSASEDRCFVSIGIMGGVPGHPFFEALVEAVPGSIAEQPGAVVAVQTGPHLATRVYRELEGTPAEPAVFGPELFYPYHYTEPHRRHETFEGAFAVHHWEASWVAPEAPADGVARVVLALDPDHPGIGAALMRAYCEAFAPGEPVELAIGVGASPSDAVGEAISALVAAVAPDPAAVPDMVVYSDDELSALPHDAAVVARGDSLEAGRELADAIACLAAIRRRIDEGAGASAPAAGPLLAAQLEVRRAADALAAEASAPAPAPAPAPATVVAECRAGHQHGTYLGDGRVLVQTVWGGKVIASARDLSLTPDLIAHGVYDVPFTNYLLRHVGQGQRVVDVGANMGLFTVLAAHLVGPAGKVIAYEANPANAELIRENVALGYLDDRVELLERAASDTAGTLDFVVPGAFAGSGSLAGFGPEEREASVHAARRFSVEAERLDARLAGTGTIDLVKIDVEGAEYRVLRGMSGLLDAGAVKRVSFELIPAHIGADWAPMKELLRTLARRGWGFALLSEAGDPVAVELDAVTGGGTYSQVLISR